MSPSEDPTDLPPTQYLIMEVLGARWRLGEEHWTFPSYLSQQLRVLEARGLLTWKHGIVARTCMAWLTEEGKQVWLSPMYQMPRVELGDT